MFRGRQLLATLAALGALWLAAAAFGASNDGALRVYKWTDSQGIVHYGDSVPAQYAQDEREVLNSDGVEIGHVAGRQSAAQQNEQAQAAQAAQQRAARDKFLLTTYASAHEIEQLRDERLEQIDGQIQASSSYIDSLTLRLAALEERAMHFAPYSANPGAQRMPDELAQDLVHTLNEAHTQRGALDAKRQEQADTRAQFETDIERYRELSARPNS
ncbi:MAG TPA: DUF4124 domain-containing protein [Steroidobacteraceae bacterium]|nr:DUF4124 domain-containing protein [Steroidobacteraceae bacterium]